MGSAWKPVGLGERRAACLAAGFDAYLPKRIDPDALAAVLDQPAIAPTAQRAPPSASPAQDQHLDEARLEHPRGMQGEHQLKLVLALIDLLLADSAQHLRQLADAQATGRPEQLRLLAHRFLSATQNIGAQRLSTLCLALERAAGDARVGDARQMLDEMATECTQVHAALLAVRPWY